MKEQDVERVAQLVREYWNLRDAGRKDAGAWYQEQISQLEEEIGSERVEEAQEEYEERVYWECETREAERIEQHYR